jgi:hypothetical protein
MGFDLLEKSNASLGCGCWNTAKSSEVGQSVSRAQSAFMTEGQKRRRLAKCECDSNVLWKKPFMSERLLRSVIPFPDLQ